MAYYDGTKLLSMQDINGKRPEIYLCTTNRTGGKTCYFSGMLVRRFKKTREKFMLIYRYKYELEDCADKFFKDIRGIWFPTDNMTSKPMAVFKKLFLNDVECGYAVSVNQAEAVKKYAHLFSDTGAMFMDEFQSETNTYVPNEVKKFISIHASVARGQGEQVRYVPTYMCGNPVSLLNPYYIELGISERLRKETRFLKGDGFVLEQGYVYSAAEAQKGSAFNRAFAKNDYVSYAGQGVYLNDNVAFIGRPEGVNRYIATLRYCGKNYAIREYPHLGFMYCDDKADDYYPVRITVTTEDHEVNYVMLRRSDAMLSQFRYFFELGAFRFKNLSCKEAVLKALAY
jgi:hypothetical protein